MTETCSRKMEGTDASSTAHSQFEEIQAAFEDPSLLLCLVVHKAKESQEGAQCNVFHPEPQLGPSVAELRLHCLDPPDLDPELVLVGAVKSRKGMVSLNRDNLSQPVHTRRNPFLGTRNMKRDVSMAPNVGEIQSHSPSGAAIGTAILGFSRACRCALVD